MKKLILLFVLFNTLTSIAQLNFENGYYITDTGEKIEGLIYNEDWNISPTEFQFKASENADATVHTIKNVQEFAVSDYIKYVRATVDMDRSSEQTSSLTRDRNPIFNSETLFLRVLIEGGATLYYYQEPNLSRFFYKMNENPIEQLVYKTYQEKADITKYYGKSSAIKANNQYKQQLLNDLKCEELSMQDFEGLEYKKRDLTTIFKEYNNCSNTLETNFTAKKERDAFNFTVKTGVLHSSLKIENPSGYKEADFGSQTTVRFGIEAEYIFAFNNNKWSIFVDPSYYTFKAEKVIIRSQTGFATNNVTAVVDYKNLEVPVGVRHYLFLSKDSKLFINTALVVDLGSGNFYTKDSNFFDYKLKPRTHFLLGAGYKFKDKVSIELRHNIQHKIVSSTNIDSGLVSSSIILGYTIF